MRSANSPITLLATGLAAQLHKQPDDVYVHDLAHVLKDSAPLLLELLHQAEGEVRFTFTDGALFLLTTNTSKRLL